MRTMCISPKTDPGFYVYKCGPNMFVRKANLFRIQEAMRVVF